MTIAKKISPSREPGRVAMVSCPAKCKDKFHPATMAFCPYTKVPLNAASVGALPATIPDAKSPSSKKTRASGMKISRILNPTVIALVFLLIVAGGIIYLISLPGSPKRELAALDTSRMVPVRTLQGRNVWMDVSEVTVEEFSAIMGRRPPVPKGFGERHPVVNVSYAEAEEYAGKVGKRLCTEEEWRAAVGTKLDFSRAVVGQTSGKSEGDVPQDRDYTLDRSEIGVYNLLGNVSEWIASPGGTPHYIGASWKDEMTEETKQLRPVERQGGSPAPFIGFRCCADVDETR